MRKEIIRVDAPQQFDFSLVTLQATRAMAGGIKNLPGLCFPWF